MSISPFVSLNLGSVKGATGEQGPQGETGDTGPAGTGSTVDTAITQTSTNAVTSAALYAEFATKQDMLEFDASPTDNSNNLLKSGAIKTALDAKQDSLTWDDEPTADSDNAISSGAVAAAIGDFSLATDSGWLTYTNGVFTLRYRKIGVMVFVESNVDCRGTSSFSLTQAALPAGYRPGAGPIRFAVMFVDAAGKQGFGTGTVYSNGHVRMTEGALYMADGAYASPGAFGLVSFSCSFIAGN